MSNKRTTLEVIAPTIEEALADGLRDLGLTEDDVDVEILDEGSRGLFGLGSRQVRIRLTVKVQQKPTLDKLSAASSTESHRDSNMDLFTIDSSETINDQDKMSVLGETESDESYILDIARDTVAELLAKMKVDAQVTSYFGEAIDSRRRIPVYVDISGQDLSILIGRQTETLNALQYISMLIIGKELGRSITLILDVEGYRKRREQQVRQLARRMADQAIKTGRRQVLEPMPANERRLVHIELRANEQVQTESIGEEPRRKVTIIPIE